MKQSYLIASVLAGGALAGGAGVLVFQTLKPATPPAAVSAQTQASTPAVAQPPAAAVPAPVAQVAAVAPSAASTPNTVVKKPAPAPARYAKILSITPIRQAGSESKQVCHQEQYQQQAPVQDSHRVTGSVIGGVLGGVLGHQIGGGNGKTAATVVGALAGGYAGNKTQENMQQRDQTIATRTICNTEEVPTKKIVGYNVRYSLDGKIGTVRKDHRPKGKTLPASNGQLL